MWMPLLAGLSRLMSTRAGHWILSILAFFGLNWVAQEFAIDPLLNLAKDYISAGPAELIPWLSFLNIDRYITMILSAYAVAAAGGALKMRMKKGR